MIAESKVKKWGNSLGLVIPKDSAEKLEIEEGDEVSIDIVKKRRLDGFGICRGARPFKRDEHTLDRW